MIDKNAFRPFSDNVIFIDTEFSSLDPYRGEILSIGLVKLNGDELYVELEYEGEVDGWVKDNIIPTLTEPKLSREAAVKKVNAFIGNMKPYMVGYVNQFDAVYWYKLFRPDSDPLYWLPIDFASILFAFGVNPESYDSEDKDNFYQEIGIDPGRYRKHHALDDARLLREVYLKLVEYGK